jgi:hypothetical protein
MIKVSVMSQIIVKVSLMPKLGGQNLKVKDISVHERDKKNGKQKVAQ